MKTENDNNMEKKITIGTRIFPYYKDAYLGVEPTGYSNIKAAKKYMKDIPNEYVYEALGGKDKYKLKYGYFYPLDKQRMKCFLDDEGIARKTFSECYCTAREGCKYLNEFSEEDQLQLLNDLHKIKSDESYIDDENIQAIREFENKWSLYPLWYTDTYELRKKEKELSKDVVFKEGNVNITIDFINE